MTKIAGGLGFETGVLADEGLTDQTVLSGSTRGFDTVEKHSGTKSWKTRVVAGSTPQARLGAANGLTDGVPLYVKFWYMFSALPVGNKLCISSFSFSGSVFIAQFFLDPAGRLLVGGNGFGADYVSSYVLAPMTWYQLEMKYAYYGTDPGGATEQGRGSWVAARINGNDLMPWKCFYSSNLGFGRADLLHLGNPESFSYTNDITWWIDDYQLNNALGGSDNSWPGSASDIPSSYVNLEPVLAVPRAVENGKVPLGAGGASGGSKLVGQLWPQG